MAARVVESRRGSPDHRWRSASRCAVRASGGAYGAHHGVTARLGPPTAQALQALSMTVRLRDTQPQVRYGMTQPLGEDAHDHPDCSAVQRW